MYTGLVSKDFVEGTDTDFGGNIGGDVKIGVTPSLNLDLTFNPDFSQVEADVQQTNLTRFELFYPEQRQFFLENQDIFASFGASRITSFFFQENRYCSGPKYWSLYVQNRISFWCTGLVAGLMRIGG
jgi:hypothetical protein